MTEALNALAANIVSRRKTGAEPYILFLGAGASISSGCSSMLALADDLLRSHDPALLSSWQTEIAEAEKLSATFGNLQRQEINVRKVARFLEVWKTLDSDSRHAFLRKHLMDGKVPSQGYADLAALIQAGFFTTILTTNLDTLMEKALQGAGLLQPENFIVVVNGKDSPAEVADQLENSRAPIRLVKLHGTLESPRSYAFTPEEIFGFEKSIRPSIARIVNQSLVVVGHSMQDRDINTLFEEDGKEIHFVNSSAPQSGGPIENVLAVRGLGGVISGADGSFDAFFGKLRREVETLLKETLNNNSGSSIEVFLRGLGLEAELKAPRSRYKNLDTLYVKPTEYDEIVSKLENDHLVFIIGEPHMGKTYTALYLLWQYHQEGYETIHIRHDRLINLLHRHDDNLKELLLELFTPEGHRSRMVHFDDPFGETSERRTEAIANKLDMFLQMAKSYEHLRVIVTSRLNIFNEALSDRSDDKLQSLEKTLRVHTSYRREVLLDILHRYVGFYKPAWANDKKITAELDEKLPLMLPAPHNIEFFVNTSETLNSLDAVLAHVEGSKKMISALAGWIKHMSPHEQIFLMWIEICSTASILFPGTGGSEIDIERAFRDHLAYLFSEGHLPGIPTMPFQIARDKFETILIERRDDRDGRLLRLDFVHPSYHEAFWYAVNRKFPMAHWWELLCANPRNIPNLTKAIDLVQLKMIERYGTINRDLDQLLLSSAESKNQNEQLIALEHMLDRPEQFGSVPQFTACVTSVVSGKNPAIKLGFLNLYQKHFETLPLSVLRLGLPLLFDSSGEVRFKAEEVIGSRIDELPLSVRNEVTFRRWEVLLKLVPDAHRTNLDREYALSSIVEDRLEGGMVSRDALIGLSPSDIVVLAQIPSPISRKAVIELFDASWQKLSKEQREAVLVNTSLDDDSDNARQAIESFVGNHPAEFLHLHQYEIVRDLGKILRTFQLTADRDLESAFMMLPPEQWPLLPTSIVREFANMGSFGFGFLLTRRIVENFEKLKPEARDNFLESLYLPTSLPSLLTYIRKEIDKPRLFRELSATVLIKLTRVVGRVQYETLTALLVRFASLSRDQQAVVNDIVHNPLDWWVGASIGQLCVQYHDGLLAESVIDLPFHIMKSTQKSVSGAMLSEIAQSYLDSSIGLQARYQPLLHELLMDPEIVQHAELWMDHSRQEFGFLSDSYWSEIKTKMRKLR